jgi:hypothetical protein
MAAGERKSGERRVVVFWPLLEAGNDSVIHREKFEVLDGELRHRLVVVEIPSKQLHRHKTLRPPRGDR